MTRLKLEHSLRGAVVAMVGGNPGATVACMELAKVAEAVDPDSALRAMGPIFALDGLGIYEERIWMLCKDVCDMHLGKVIALLRAHQMGQLAGVTADALNHAIDNRGDGLDLDAVVKAVQEKLPAFTVEAGQPETTPESEIIADA